MVHLTATGSPAAEIVTPASECGSPSLRAQSAGWRVQSLDGRPAFVRQPAPDELSKYDPLSDLIIADAPYPKWDDLCREFNLQERTMDIEKDAADDLACRLIDEGRFELYRTAETDQRSKQVWMTEFERDLIVKVLHKFAASPRE